MLPKGQPVEKDVYFHLAIARDYSAQPLRYSTNLAEGVQASRPADREPLFHLGLAVLHRLGIPPLACAMVSSCAVAGALGVIAFCHSRSLIIVLLTLFATNTFMFRLCMGRPHGLAVALVLLGIVLLIRGKYKSLAIVNLIYTLSYSVPVLLLAAGLFESIAKRKWRGLAWTLLSSASGLLIHPHFPNNLILLWFQGFHVMKNAYLGSSSGVPVPDELTPWSLGQFAIEAWLPLSLFSIALFKKIPPLWLSLFQLALLLLTLRSMRFIEYWAPLVCLLSGPAVQTFTPETRTLRWIALILLILARPVVGTYSIRGEIPNFKSKDLIYQKAALWLKENAAGKTVFNAEWDAYPELRYFGGNFKISQGMDPVFVAAWDPEKYRRMKEVIDGKIPPADFLQAFPATYLVAKAGSKIWHSRQDPGVKICHSDAHAVVLSLLKKDL